MNNKKPILPSINYKKNKNKYYLQSDLRRNHAYEFYFYSSY